MVASLSCYLKDDRVILVFPALTLEGETVWRDIRQHRVRCSSPHMTSCLLRYPYADDMREYFHGKGRSTACKTTWVCIYYTRDK